MYDKLYGVRKEHLDFVLDAWEAGATSRRIVQLLFELPDRIAYTRRHIDRAIYFARNRKDPRAVYHGPRDRGVPRNSMLNEKSHYVKPADSLFRRK